MVRQLAASVDLTGFKVLDLGCGEGKNAAFLSTLGCQVEAWDISRAALQNARAAWPEKPIRWLLKDARNMFREDKKYNLVIAYGLLHCLPRDDILPLIGRMQLLTYSGGYNIIACYNNRKHENIALAHPAFRPTLLPHELYVRAYSGWRIENSSDEDLTEFHPNNMVQHMHSMTRISAQNWTGIAYST